jgi:tartrate-resistant acid phosphatase type 5
MKKLVHFFLAACCLQPFLLFAQSNYSKEIESGYTGDTISNIKSLKKALSFCVIGDWGRNGQYYQKEVAKKLGAAMVGIDGKFIISTGDNFYPKGVKSVADPLFKTSFEDIYTEQATHEDWYVVLGNHDYKENPEAQIEYSKISRRWKMPARYYSFTKQIEEGSTVEFFCIDSNPFQTDYYKETDYETAVKSQDTAAQKKWLIESLQKSTATWKIVVGHHPLYSAGKRKGKTGDMENSFAPIFNQYKVDAYLCGHEHHLEYDKTTAINFHHYISGAGSEARPVGNAPYAKFVAAEHGFFAFSISNNQMLVQAINHVGNIVFSHSIKK